MDSANGPHLKFVNARFAAMQGAYFVVYSGVTAFCVTYLLAHGLSNHLIGILIAVASLVAALIQPVLGNWADRSQRFTPKLAVLCMCVLGIASTAGLIINGSMVPTMFFYALLWIAVQATQPFVNSLGLSYGPDVNFGLARSFGSLSFAIGAALIGVLIGFFGLPVTNVVIIVCWALLAASLLLFPKVKDQEDAQHLKELSSPEAEEKPLSSLEFLRHYTVFILILLVAFFTLFGHSGIQAYLVHMVNLCGGGSTELGYANAISAVCELPAMIGYNFLRRRFKCETILLVAIIFFFVKSVVMLFATSMPLVYFAEGLQMLTFGLYLPAIVDYANTNMRRKDAVKGQSLITSAQTLSTAASSVAGGILLDAAGVFNTFSVWVVASIIAMVMLIIALAKTRNKQEGEGR